MAAQPAVDQARAQPLTSPYPITPVDEGMTLCAVTNLGSVAWLKVISKTDYFDDGGSKVPKPTLNVVVTLWKLAA